MPRGPGSRFGARTVQYRPVQAAAFPFHVKPQVVEKTELALIQRDRCDLDLAAFGDMQYGLIEVNA